MSASESDVPGQQAAPAGAAGITDPAPEPVPSDAAAVPAERPEESGFSEIDHAIRAFGARVAQLSASGAGIRFSTLLKQQQGIAAERDALLAQQDEGRRAEQVRILEHRLAQYLTELAPPLPPASGWGASTLRQALVRSMVLLAPAPLRLAIEIDPAFPFDQSDPFTLAVRVHQIHRAALGTLTRIDWMAPDRARLSFGDGAQRRSAEASFSPEGALVLDAAFRQQPGRPATASSGPRPGPRAGQRPGASGQQHRPPTAPGQGRRGGPRTGASETPPQRHGRGQPASGQNPGNQDNQGQGNPADRPPRKPFDSRREGNPAGQGNRGGRPSAGHSTDPAGRGAPSRPQGARGGRDGRDGRDARDGRNGGDRARPDRASPGKPPRAPSFPRNSLMGDKLRAAFARGDTPDDEGKSD